MLPQSRLIISDDKNNLQETYNIVLAKKYLRVTVYRQSRHILRKLNSPSTTEKYKLFD